MKCLTYGESQKWLAAIDVQIDGNRNLLLPIRPENVMTTMPQKAFALNFFSARLTDWFTPNSSRMIWLSNWETYPSDQFILFQKFRLGCGETRTPIEAPGHLFENSTEEENAIFTAFVFFVMAFNWQAYIVAKNHNDYIYLGDEYIVFSSTDEEKLKQVSELRSNWKLEIIKEIKEAWK